MHFRAVGYQLSAITCSTQAIVVMTKYPSPGKVKTRLMPALTGPQAAEVHRVFLEHWVRRLRSLALGDLVICFDPPDAASRFRELFPDPAIELIPQSDGDLGLRLVEAATALRARFDRLIFVGADSPDLPALEISAADITLGPTADGGFYMLAGRSDLDYPALFAGIAWSSGRERAQIIERSGALGYTVSLASGWDDIDHPADLARLIDRLRGSPAASDRRLLADLSFVPREKLT